MISRLLSSIFGSRNDRLLKKYQARVAAINALEPAMQALSDEQLTAKTAEFRQQLADGKKLEELLVPAFAVCREAGRRVLGMRHFDVQLVGGMVLHEGKISEMRTGEGKTLVATLAAYLNALEGKGVHVVTVNDYLAARDAQWMGRLYSALGLTTGMNLSQLDHDAKQAAYACDITYGTNNEFGFDYLRDNMVSEIANRVQRGLNYAIVDEVDSILIDEARTPLIISGHADDSPDLYLKLNSMPAQLNRQPLEDGPGDYFLDEKGRQVNLSDSGFEKAEQLLGEMGLLAEGSSLYDSANISLLHHLMAALRAHTLYFRDQQYVVQNGKVVIVDEFTGRLMSGRRWSDGLHQAVEAKEGVKIQSENQTMASITFQNYFRLYTKLSGMTGTADTEAFEFQSIYGLETVVVPPNRINRRDDQLDRVYKTTPEKYQAAIEDIRSCYDRGQPVLVGTSSIENSEIIANLLKEANLPHEVLNAKQHEREADIIAQAGRLKAITIATNMAGRGTDIVLGGNLEKLFANAGLDVDDDTSEATTALRAQWETEHEAVKALGGLRIIATERHESRRIDNQLRGRSGRQGDPGSSRFYLSLDDSLMRIFAGDRVRAIMDRLKMPEGEAIEAGMVTRSIESAQRKVEARNFDIRKQLLDYDDVSNDQRKVIYQQRNDILDATSLRDQVAGLREGCFISLTRQYVPEESVEEQWDLSGLERVLRDDWQIEADLAATVSGADVIDDADIVKIVTDKADAMYATKVERVGDENFTQFERMVLLQTVDSSWREHLSALDYLRQGIHLRGYAQKQPKQEYKRGAFELFGLMLDSVRDEVTRILTNVRITEPESVDAAAAAIEARGDDLSQAQYTAPTETGEAQDITQVLFSDGPRLDDVPRVGRNDACPCGSGKKYKHCHGALA